MKQCTNRLALLLLDLKVINGEIDDAKEFNEDYTKLIKIKNEIIKEIEKLEQ